MNQSKINNDNVIIAVDIGTTETKSTLIGLNGFIDCFKIKNNLICFSNVCVEQDPLEIKQSIINSIKEILKKNNHLVSKICGIVFTSQMQGLLPVDKEGNPLMNFLTWLDARAASLTRQKLGKGWPKISGYPLKYLIKFLPITGGAPGYDGKNTLSKTYWIKKERPKIFNKTYKFLDTKDYAVFLATNQIVTSVDMAYVTWLMDTRPKNMNWSPKIFDLMELDIEKFPEIKLSTALIGEITSEFAEATSLPKKIPVVNGSGDLLTSALGSGAIKDGELHANIGTAGWVGAHYSKKKTDIPHYTGSIASAMPSRYLILSKQETLGGALEWFKNKFLQNELIELKTDSNNRLINEEIDSENIYKIIDKLVEQAPIGSKNLIFAPWLTGERSPINNPLIRSVFFNIGLENDLKDFMRSIFEGIAYNLLWGLEIVEKLVKIKPLKKTKRDKSKNKSKNKNNYNEIRVIGGASKSDVWCQIFADVWNKKVIRMKYPQYASSIGAACIAYVGLGIFSDFSEISKITSIDKEFYPNENALQIYKPLYCEYTKIYKKLKKMFYNLNESY
ncbi:MAG: xylulokinase [Promethearchaeota archaeon]